MLNHDKISTCLIAGPTHKCKKTTYQCSRIQGSLQQDKSADAIQDKELLLQFRKIEKLPADKKIIVKELIDAFIFKADLQKQLQQG